MEARQKVERVQMFEELQNKEPLTKMSLTNFLNAQAKIATAGQSKLCGFQAQVKNR